MENIPSLYKWCNFKAFVFRKQDKVRMTKDPSQHTFMVILIVLKWQNSGCACVYFNNYVACIALHYLPAVRPCNSSNIYTVKWWYFLMRIPENTWEKRAPIMLCSNAPLLIMFSRVVCYAHNIIHELCRKYKSWSFIWCMYSLQC